jgi:hypothetical protein
MEGTEGSYQVIEVRKAQGAYRIIDIGKVEGPQWAQRVAHPRRRSTMEANEMCKNCHTAEENLENAKSRQKETEEA